MTKLIVLMTAMMFSVVGKAQSNDRFVGADLIVFNARVTTGTLAQPEASAVAVKRGRIYAVGTDAEILSLKDNNTRLIDAGRRRLIPGLNDAHVHVLNERSYNYNVRWDGVPTLKRALEMLSEQAIGSKRLVAGRPTSSRKTGSRRWKSSERQSPTDL
jgi:predicted amidohydrolase YtcJ